MPVTVRRARAPARARACRRASGSPTHRWTPAPKASEAGAPDRSAASQDFATPPGEDDHRGFIEDQPPAFDDDLGVRGSQVDRHIGAQPASQGPEHAVTGACGVQPVGENAGF